VAAVVFTSTDAAGREADNDAPAAPPWKLSREILAPRVLNGTLQYILMEIVVTDRPENNWMLRHKATQPAALPLNTPSEPLDTAFSTAGIPRRVLF